MSEKTAAKMYVLLDEYNSTTPVYQKINKTQRVRILDKRPVDHAYLKMTIWNPALGKNQNIRLKLNANTIDQTEQIKQLDIPANEPHTAAEKKAVQFTYGVCIATNPIVQQYLEANPQFEGTANTTDDDTVRKLYRLLDKRNEDKISNRETRKRIKAATKVFDMGYEEIGDLMIRVNGEYFELPEDIEARQNAMIEWLDNTDEDGVDKVLDDQITVDERVTLLLGKLEKAGLLSYDAVPDHVALMKDKQPRKLKKIVNDYPLTERKELFKQFLLNDAGSLVLEELIDLGMTNVGNEGAVEAEEPQKPAKKPKP